MKKEIKILKWIDDKGIKIAGSKELPLNSFGMAEVLDSYFQDELKPFTSYLGNNYRYDLKRDKWINRNHDPKVESNWKGVTEVYEFYVENEKSIRIS